MAVRESAIPQQGVGGPVTAQDINGKDCVQAQKKSRGKGEPAGDGGDDLSHKRLDPVNQQKTQPAPEKGEEKAHPPMDLKGEMGVVPEGNMQKYFVKEAHQIFSGGGRKGGPQSQQDDMPRQKRGGGQVPLVLEELAPGVTVEEVRAKTEADLMIPDEIGCMV